jgi:hypothetical protein
MAAFSRAVTGRIFISYRREDNAYPAGWLYDRLADQFGKDQVFKDVDSIQLGDDFVEVITRAVASCDVLLAVIGRQWLTITDERGGRRLDRPNDFVRLEIEAALKREIRVIPVLIDGARMPDARQLPRGLGKLARRHALELSPNRFSSDFARLLAVLEKTISDKKASEFPARVASAGNTGHAPEDNARPVAQRKPQPLPRRPSPADEAWRRAAQVITAPISNGTTHVGLPRRVPMANLIPGSAGRDDAADDGAASGRSPDAVRTRMTSFQRGVREGRAAARENLEP